MNSTPEGKAILAESKGAITNASKRFAVAGIVGTEWKDETYNGKVVGRRATGGPKLAGVAGALGIAGDIVGVYQGLQDAHAYCGSDCSAVEVANSLLCAVVPGCGEPGYPVNPYSREPVGPVA